MVQHGRPGAERSAGEAVVDQLLADLELLEEPAVLVIDDLHELDSADALGVARDVSGQAAGGVCAWFWRLVRTRGSAFIVCVWPVS